MLLGTAAGKCFAVLEYLVMLSLQLEVESEEPGRESCTQWTSLFIQHCKVIRVHDIRTPGFHEFGMQLNSLGTFSDEESRSSCRAAWHTDVARSLSFPSILFVMCCAWLCLRAVKAINSHLPLFNSVQRNIGAGPSEVCQAAPRVMVLGICSVVTTAPAWSVPCSAMPLSP